MSRSYVCYVCRETFNTDWSEEERDAESQERFGRTIKSDPTMVQVCDDCYQLILDLDPKFASSTKAEES